MSGVDARCLGEACVWCARCARWGSHSHKTTNNKMCTETEAFNRSDVTEPEIAPRGIGVKIHRESLRERRKDQRRRQSQAQGHKGHRRFQATGATCRVRIAKRPRQLLARGLPGDLIRGYCPGSQVHGALQTPHCGPSNTRGHTLRAGPSHPRAKPARPELNTGKLTLMLLWPPCP